MVLTGFEVFGAVSGGLGTLNLARSLFQSLSQVVRDYHEAGAQLVNLRKRLIVFQAQLEAWAKVWQINDATPDDIFVEYWDNAGRDLIWDELGAIDKTVDDFASLLSKLLPDDAVNQLSTQARADVLLRRDREIANWTDPENLVERFGQRAIRREESRQLGILARRTPSVKDKAQFIISKSQELSRFVEDLKERYTMLREMSSDLYEAKHPEMPRNISINERRAAAAASLLLKQAQETKAASETLFWACAQLNEPVTGGPGRDLLSSISSTKQPSFPHLELNLLVEDSRGASSAGLESCALLKLRYHILIARPEHDQQHEIVVEGPFASPKSASPSKVNEEVEITLAEACSIVRDQSSCEFLEYLQADPSICVRFRLVCPTNSLYPGELNGMQFDNFLRRIQWMTSAEAHEQFPLRERLNLAFKVAECGLLLLGTSWLSTLSSRNIKRLSRPDWTSRRRFLLEAGLTTENDFSSVEPQTFSIGVLLAEIATGQAVERIRPYQDGSGVKLDLMMAYLRHGSEERRAFPAEDVVRRVDQHAGAAYGRAVEFCLQQSLRAKRMHQAHFRDLSSWKEREQAYYAILIDYHAEVYLP